MTPFPYNLFPTYYPHCSDKILFQHYLDGIYQKIEATGVYFGIWHLFGIDLSWTYFGALFLL